MDQSASPPLRSVLQDDMSEIIRTPSPLSSEINLVSGELAPHTPAPALPGSQFRIPKTPFYEVRNNIILGLPSPETPSFVEQNGAHSPSNATREEDLSGSGSVNWTRRPSYSPITSPSASPSNKSRYISPIDDRAPVTSIERDTEVAFQLASPSARRSNRVKAKSKIEEFATNPRAVIAPKKKANKKPPPPSPEPEAAVISQAEPSESPFNVALSADNELPPLHTTEWWLKYPPGGSTHPSYPWPLADPRLTFASHLVPLKNGLPNVSLVPALLLPMGWRHVTWAGLLPVVSDPHQQLFKLTPVGPLPLTCEELQQGGLHHYAPGEKSHPEAGLLPTLLHLSDGSDADIFNFEGVTWALPWAGEMSAFSMDVREPSKVSARRQTMPVERAFPVIESLPHYLEDRDCPDGIIDLEEGWRWLCEREVMPSLAFSATPGKTWKGTGAYCSTRKWKSPIASLMVNTISESEKQNRERYLLKQDNREFDAFKSVATPVHINIAFLQDVEFTLVELLSYFPSHFHWRKGGDRLARSGMGARDILSFIHMSRLVPGADICSSQTVHEKMYYNRLDDGTRVKVSLSEAETLSYTAADWTNSAWETTDYPLLALAHGLVELPSGVDAGPLTSLIRWCRENKHYRVMLSEVPDLLTLAGLDSVIDTKDSADPDREVLSRHAESIRKHRRQVLREQQESEHQGHGKLKRRKLE